MRPADIKSRLRQVKLCTHFAVATTVKVERCDFFVLFIYCVKDEAVLKTITSVILINLPVK